MIFLQSVWRSQFSVQLGSASANLPGQIKCKAQRVRAVDSSSRQQQQRQRQQAISCSSRRHEAATTTGKQHTIILLLLAIAASADPSSPFHYPSSLIWLARSTADLSIVTTTILDVAPFPIACHLDNVRPSRLDISSFFSLPNSDLLAS